MAFTSLGFAKVVPGRFRCILTPFTELMVFHPGLQRRNLSFKLVYGLHGAGASRRQREIVEVRRGSGSAVRSWPASALA